MSRHLIIRALHRDTSFLSQGVDRLQEKLLEDRENTVEIRDLYELQFNPVLTTEDFEALKSGHLPEDIRREQDHITRADFIWVVFPIWWTSMPAVLKGYIDRVFLSGFAYKMEGDRPVGLLTNKKVAILNSMGMSREEYKASGMFDALALTIDKGVFEFAGMEVVAHRYYTSIMSAGDEQREEYFRELTGLAEQFNHGATRQKAGDQRHVA